MVCNRFARAQLMLSPYLVLWGLLLLSTLAFANASENLSIKTAMNADWRFTHSDNSVLEPRVFSSTFDDSSWQRVNLPHDWSIKNIAGTNSPFNKHAPDKYDTGYTQGGIGWYRKHITVNKALNDHRAILEFGGIYMNSAVYVNGHHAGGQHYGYTSFWLDISPYLHHGDDNIIVVKVNNNHLNSRWYSGSGIYRPVTLTFKPKLHLKHWGTAITTPVVNEKYAQVNISSELTVPASMVNIEIKQPITLTLQLRDQDDRLVVQTTKILSSANLSSANLSLVKLTKKTLNVSHQFVVNSPILWSPTQPKLYTLTQILSYNGAVKERTQTPFGIRSLSFSAQHGFSINGESLLLKGMNVHHGNYLLGAEAHRDAEVRKVKRILSAGYNAVRTAHNPPSQAFLTAADSLGLLVINEVFDAWNKPKWDHKNDYSSRFKQDWQQELTNFIERDRNHPSVIMWSVGNEIPEQNDQVGADSAAMLTAFATTLDNSREITIGANTSGEKSDPYLKNFNIVGYNYQQMNYQSDHQRFPKRVMYGSETYSNKAFGYWRYVEKYPYIIGDFVWTGWDYLGEAAIGWTGYGPQWQGLGGYPWTLAYCGEMDALGFKRPSGYYRDVLWKTGNNKLSVFVHSPIPSLPADQYADGYLDWVQPDLHPSWSWPSAAGKVLAVEIYSVFDSVELFLNGNSLGKQATSIKTEYKAHYQVPYEAGQLKAVGYIKGVASEESILTTAGRPSEIRLNAESNTINADGQSLVYITGTLFDEQGQRVYHWDDDLAINFSVAGVGQLLALGNANPRSAQGFTNGVRDTFRGRVVAVVQSIAGKTGTITLTASAKGLTAAPLTVQSISH